MKLSVIYFLCLKTVICLEMKACFKKMYFRGIGQIGSICEENLEKSGLLCYSKCQSGYRGAGPVCWPECEAGFTDYGSFCWKNSHIYGKGCCCTIFTKECCGNCPTGYRDDGCTCRRDFEVYHKRFYGRGLGKIMICDEKYETDAGLCYERCKDGYFGFGPLCFLNCDKNKKYSSDCGSFCGRNSTTCGKHVLDMMNSIASSFDLGKILQNGLGWFTQQIFQYC